MQRLVLKIVIIAFLIIFISASLSAQMPEPPPLDFERYTTPVEAQTVDQLTQLLVRQFPDYQWVDAFAVDASGHVVAVLNNHAPLITVWDPAANATRQFDPLVSLAANASYEPGPMRVAVSPDGSKLAVSTFLQVGEGVLQIWDVAAGSVVYTEVMQEPYITHTSALAFSPDGAFLVASIGAHDIAWWDTATGSRVNTISYHDYDLARTEFDNPPPGRVRDVFLTSDNRMFFGHGGAVYEWNLETNALGQTYAMTSAVRIPNAPADAVPRGFQSYLQFNNDDIIVSLAVSPDERYIATGHLRGGLRIWDTHHPAWAQSYEEWDNAITRIAPDDIAYAYGVQYNPAGDVLIAVDNDSLFAISTETWELLAQYHYPSSVISGAAFNALGSLLYVGNIEFGIAVLAVADPDAPPFEMPPSTDPGGRCRIRLAMPAYVYTQPTALDNYFVERLGPTRHVTLIGRLADNSWWQDNADRWIASSAFGPGTTVTGDCHDLPVVMP